MGKNPRIRRLTLIPAGEDEAVRRYRLARLDEVALASPPYEPPEDARAPGREEPTPDAEPDPPG